MNQKQVVRNTPVYGTLNIRIESVENGICNARVPKQEAYDGIYGFFHGGIMTTAADSVAAIIILEKIGYDKIIATTDITIRFLSPCSTDILILARPVKIGKRLAVIHLDLLDTEKEMVATAIVTYMILDRKKIS